MIEDDLRAAFDGDDMARKNIALRRAHDMIAQLRELRQREVQAIHAGISRRDWWAVETAANALRDKVDRMFQLPPRGSAAGRQVEPFRGVARDGIEAQHGLNDTYPGDPYP